MHIQRLKLKSINLLFLLPRGACAPSVSPPTVKLLVCPISRSHCYSLPPPEIVLGYYVIRLESFNIIVMYYLNINNMSSFYLFVFLFLFYMFICIYFTNVKA